MPRVPFPIVGGSYTGVSRDANPQRSVNLYSEYDDKGGRQILRGTPGLVLLATLQEESLGSESVADGNFSSAGTWTTEAKWSVAGGKLVHVAGAADTASQVTGDMTTPPVAGSTYRITFDIESISGGVLTVTLGGVEYATPFSASGSYSFEITATGTAGLIFTATANLVVSIDDASVKLLTYPSFPLRGMLAIGDYLYVIYGPYLMRLDSSFDETKLNSDSPMGSSSGLVTMAHIRVGTGFQIMICDGSDKVAYLYDTVTGLFSTLTDSEHEFQGGGSVAATDGYFLSHGVGADRFYNSEVTAGLSWDAADDSRAWVKTSDIQRVYAHCRLVYTFKEDSLEIFYNSGSAGETLPTFRRMDGGSFDIGCIAPWSVASVKNRLFWLASDKTIQMAVGQGIKTVSPLQLSYQIEQMATVSDATAYCYTEEGHDFYVLTFPTSDVTYVYDATTGEWHERQSYDTDRGVDGRHRSNCYAYFQDKHVVGDFANTKIYELDSTVYTDNGSRIRRQRTAQNVNENNLMSFFHRFEVHFEGGIGVLTGQGSSPKAMLRVSKDGGHEWSGAATVEMGSRGGYDVRSVWSRLGRGRDFSVEVSISDPVKVIILGSYLDFDHGYA